MVANPVAGVKWNFHRPPASRQPPNTAAQVAN